MLKFFFITISIGVVLSDVIYYCNSPELCKYSSYKHITCDATGGPGPKCGPEASGPYALSDEVKQKIVDLHNEYRNKIASGNQPGFPTAAKMATIEWNDNLAEYAALNIFRCEYGHDCHETEEFPNAGQNIYAYLDYSNDLLLMASKAVPSWYSEVDIASPSEISTCCPNEQKTGHFTQIVADRANRIGCAMGKFKDATNGKMTYVVCNYSVTNLEGTNVYTAGPTASKCKSGTNPKYPGLCSSSENVDPKSTA